jgi:hypothetical protein
MRRIMQHARLIDHLGGWRIVARKLDVAPTTVWRWQENGIPVEHWPALLQLAKKVGLAVTSDQLMRAHPAVRRRIGKDDLARAS